MRKGLLFDLDGVVVDTAKYHYLAWKEIADGLEIPFTPEDNERLKGVSRRQSLEILLQIGQRSMEEEEIREICDRKNERYLSYIGQLTEDQVLPGVRRFLEEARSRGYLIALGSASRNSLLILRKLRLLSAFDAIIDGNQLTHVKPHPEVFLRGAEALGLGCPECTVFEDSAAGIEAAHRAGMAAIGIGLPGRLPEADAVLPGFRHYTVDAYEEFVGSFDSSGGCRTCRR